MTDKQIIDGERMFKCVWCKYNFKESDANFILSENPNECVCSGCMTEWADNLLRNFKRKEQTCKVLALDAKVADNHLQHRIEMCDLLREKLKAKEQECEELKHKVELMMDCASCKIDEYKQTLIEIKEIAEQSCSLNSCKVGSCMHCKYLDEPLVVKRILQKISECEVENE